MLINGGTYNQAKGRADNRIRSSLFIKKSKALDKKKSLSLDEKKDQVLT